MSVQERTHDFSLTGNHVKDLDAWAQTLNQAVSAAFPGAGGNRYTDVNVLLLSWEDDDLGVATEVSELDFVFRHVYGYRTDQWKIPSTQSHIALARRILDLLTDSASSDKLLIVYYGGHAYMNDQRDCVWLCNQQPEAATAQWSSIQTTLGQADSDVLILLDCCAAASSAGSPSKGHTEVMGACGFETDTPGIGNHSFTRSLIEELRYYGERRRSISTAFLYSKILARAKDSWNPRFERNADSERRRTPVHTHLADRSKQKCIELIPMRSLPQSSLSPGSATSTSQGSSAVQSSAASTLLSEDVDMSDPADSSSSQSSVTSIESQQLLPRVLISVALEREQILRSEDWIDWLKSFPALAHWIHLESAYKSDSNLLLFSLPVALWDMLPKDPAIFFVSFVRSRNLLTPKDLPMENLGTKLSKHEASKTFNADTALGDDPSDRADRSSDPHWSSLMKSKPASLFLSFDRWESSSKANPSLHESEKTLVSSSKANPSLVGSEKTLMSPSEAYSSQVASSDSREPSSKAYFSPIRMIIHLPKGAVYETIAHLGADADVNVISMSFVKSLGLSKGRYKGHFRFRMMVLYVPQWQTTFEWHINGLPNKVYTSSFAVLDEEYCRNFNVMIGGETINKIFFQ